MLPPPAASTRKALANRADGKRSAVPDGSGVSPLALVAVSTTPDSAFVYVTPLMVELDPALIVPVSVPPSVPVPVLSERKHPSRRPR